MLNSLKDIEFVNDQRFLGEGAFSKVFHVKSNINNKDYALKVINIAQLSKSDRDNLKTEINLHKSLSHPNIINYVDALQIEFASNGCLFFFIHLQKGIPEKLAIRYLIQTTLAIQHLHQRNMIHRDIKPENILLDENLNVKICDFGWSCQTDKKTHRSSICGTVEYMSPEIIQKGKHSFKTDLWCLGVLFYEMLHGQTPFQASSMKELHQEFSQKEIRVKKNFSKDSKYFLRNLLQQEECNRYDIDQLVSSPVFQKYLYLADQQLSLEEIKTLKENYLLNCRSNKRVLPQFIERFDEIYHQFQIEDNNFNKTMVVQKQDDFFDSVIENNVSFFDIDIPLNIPSYNAEMNFFKENKNDIIEVNKVKGNEIQDIKNQIQKKNEDISIQQDYDQYATKSSNTQTFNVYQTQQNNSYYCKKSYKKPRFIKINVGDEYDFNMKKLGLKKIRSEMNLHYNTEEDSFEDDQNSSRPSNYVQYNDQHQSFRSQRDLNETKNNFEQPKIKFKKNLGKLLQNFDQQNSNFYQNKSQKNYQFKTYNQSVQNYRNQQQRKKSQNTMNKSQSRVSFNSNIQQKQSISFRNIIFNPVERQSTYNDFENTTLSKQSQSQRTFSTLATIDPSLKRKFDKMFNEIKQRKNQFRFQNTKLLTKIKQFQILEILLIKWKKKIKQIWMNQNITWYKLYKQLIIIKEKYMKIKLMNFQVINKNLYQYYFNFSQMILIIKLFINHLILQLKKQKLKLYLIMHFNKYLVMVFNIYKIKIKNLKQKLKFVKFSNIL